MRKIIHVDADCFFAALEIRDDPTLRGRPVAVGGDPGKRGVISTCSYEARVFGVHSAMASAHAMRLCPNLIIVPHSMDKYRQASRAMQEIFRDYTDLVEPLSLDEAFLDVSQCSSHSGSATRMAEEIRARVQAALGITVSAGVAPNKFVAKVASDWHKPNGLTVVPPGQVDGFVAQLPVQRIHGVGKVTAARMQQMGIHSCADLRRYSALQLSEAFGSFGGRLYELCRGLDERPVKPSRTRKSLSVEHTFARDLPDVSQCLARLPALFGQLCGRLGRLDSDYQILKSFVKMKFNDFGATTVERVGMGACLDDYHQLLAEAFQRGGRPVRLLGIGVRFKDHGGAGPMQQLDFFESA